MAERGKTGPRGKTGETGARGERGERGRRGYAIGRYVGWYVVLMVTLIAFLVALDARQAGSGAQQSAEDARQSSRQLRDAVIDACMHVRKPLHSYFTNEIETTRNTDPSLFPDIPPAVFQALIAEKIRRLQNVQSAVNPERCAEEYE